MANTYLVYFKRNLPAVILIVGGLLIFWWGHSTVMTFIGWISDRHAVTEFIQKYEAEGMVLYVLLLALQLFVAFIPGQALVIAGGYIFGFIPALTITIPVAVASSQFAFHLTRRYGRPLAYRFVTQKVVDRWEKISNRQGIMFYFLAFILPVFPSDAMCYIAGLGTISPKRFFVANLIGRCSSTVFTVMVGAYGIKLPPIFWVTVGLVMTASYIGWLYYSRKNSVTKMDNTSTPLKESVEKYSD